MRQNRTPLPILGRRSIQRRTLGQDASVPELQKRTRPDAVETAARSGSGWKEAKSGSSASTFGGNMRTSKSKSTVRQPSSRYNDRMKATPILAKIAAAANRSVAGSSRSFPKLSPTSSRDVLITWLRRVDPNGIWTDEDLVANDMDPMTEADAWEQIVLMIKD